MSDPLVGDVEDIARLSEEFLNSILNKPKPGVLKLPKPLDPQIKEVLVVLVGQIIAANARINALEHTIQNLLSYTDNPDI